MKNPLSIFSRHIAILSPPRVNGFISDCPAHDGSDMIFLRWESLGIHHGPDLSQPSLLQFSFPLLSLLPVVSWQKSPYLVLALFARLWKFVFLYMPGAVAFHLEGDVLEFTCSRFPFAFFLPSFSVA